MIKTRVAPSPTWNLHLWTARTALYSYLYARQNWWKFLLRVEDTDTARSTKFYEEDIIQWLSWLWMEYDAGPDKEDEFWPYHQMQRTDTYWKYIDKLLEEWKAYYAWETSEELDIMREQSAKEKKPFVYRQINYTDEQINSFKAEWRVPVIRFKVEPKKVSYNDLVKWEVTFDMSQFADFVIVKWDWVPTFYLVNVIDDYLMWITHILRWEDHIPNTPKQILLYEALNFEIPDYGHLPMLLNANRSKMSKRDSDNELVTISKFQQEWFLPQPLINFIALLWWHPSNDEEQFSMSDLIEKFSIERIQVSNAVYDYKRALWFNSDYIKNMPNSEFVNSLIDYLSKYWDQEWKEILKITEKDYWMKFAPYIKVRMQTLSQFRDFAKYFFKMQFPNDDIIFSEKMKVTKELVLIALPELLNMLTLINDEDWTEENIKNNLVEYINSKWYKNWQILWPLRAILTWVEASPWAFEMLYVLWKVESINRLKAYLEMIS